MATILLIAFSGGSEQESVVEPFTAVGIRGQCNSCSVHCASARKAVRFYQRRHHEWKLKTGVVTRQPARLPHCPRNYAKYWKAKAYEARVGYQRWFTYQYAWWKWLPRNWVNLARCETGINWEHSNSSFTSAFGISWAVYNGDARHMGAPPWHVRHTPRDQYKAALGHLDMYGDGWSCPGP